MADLFSLTVLHESDRTGYDLIGPQCINYLLGCLVMEIQNAVVHMMFMKYDYSHHIYDTTAVSKPAVIRIIPFRQLFRWFCQFMA